MTDERTKAIRGTNYSEAMKDAGRRLFIEGMRPPSIARELEVLFPDAERWPDERTVRGWSKKWGIDQSGPWAFGGDGDPAIVLPMLAALIEETAGKISSVTNAEAGELTRLGHSVDGMPALGMYNWARAMIATRAAQEPLEPLLHYVSFRPWEDEGRRYLAAADAGWIKELRSFCPGDAAWLPVQSRRIQGGLEIGAWISRRSGGRGDDSTGTV
jgi:hypothetical protein